MAELDGDAITGRDEKPVKRARVDDVRSFSDEPDVSVQVEDEVFEVHSVVLMLASPFFKSTMTSSMSESSSGIITLHDKKKCEFQTFMDAIKPGTVLDIDRKNVYILSRWADEYQVDGLKHRCEQYLIQ